VRKRIIFKEENFENALAGVEEADVVKSCF